MDSTVAHYLRRRVGSCSNRMKCVTDEALHCFDGEHSNASLGGSFPFTQVTDEFCNRSMRNPAAMIHLSSFPEPYGMQKLHNCKAVIPEV